MRNYIVLSIFSLVLSIILTGQNNPQGNIAPNFSIIKTTPVQQEAKSVSCSSIPLEMQNTQFLEGKTLVEKIAESGNVIAEYSSVVSNPVESKISDSKVNQPKFKIYRNKKLVFAKKILSDNTPEDAHYREYIAAREDTFSHRDFAVRDIDNDGEVEIIVIGLTPNDPPKTLGGGLYHDRKSYLIYKYNQKNNCYQGKIVDGLPSFEEMNYEVKQTSSLDNIKAINSYRSRDYWASGNYISNVNLQIFKDDRLISDTPINDNGIQHGSLPLQMADLDGDLQPEVILHTFTGGSCCYLYLIYYYDSDNEQFISNKSIWTGAGHPRFQDLDKDGVIDIVSRDDRFDGPFYHGSKPLRVFHFHNGEFVDVTRLFQTEIRKDMERISKKLSTTHNPYFLKSILAAYLADKYMLDEGDDGWEQVRKIYQESDREEFFTSVEQFLYSTGYIQDSYSHQG